MGQLRLLIYVFTQPLHTSRIRHKANWSLTGLNSDFFPKVKNTVCPAIYHSWKENG